MTTDHQVTVTRVSDGQITFSASVPAKPDNVALARLCDAVRKPRVRTPKP